MGTSYAFGTPHFLSYLLSTPMTSSPLQMMDNLLLSVGDLVNLKNVSLPKGSFIKIQPHTTTFLDIANPKAVLETCLRSFTCLTQVRRPQYLLISPTSKISLCTVCCRCGQGWIGLGGRGHVQEVPSPYSTPRYTLMEHKLNAHSSMKE